MVKNSPCNAGDASPMPGQGIEVPRAAEQLSISLRAPNH